jgi:signal transduction histidine kinase
VVHVQLFTTDDHVVLVVADDGIGFDVGTGLRLRAPVG